MDAESRIIALEHAVASIREDVAIIRSNYVTKADLEELRKNMEAKWLELRLDMERGNAQLRLDMEQGNAQLRRDMEHGYAQLRLDMEHARNDTEKSLHKATRWMIGTALTMFIGFCGVTITLVNMIKPF